MNEKKVLIAIIGLTIIGLLTWLFWESKPKPGTLEEDQGRGHVPIGAEVKYKTNLPTSGQHYEEWIKTGVYDHPLDDRNLVHSLEHGYVVISYNCAFKHSFLNIPPAFAQSELKDMMRELTVSAKDATAAAPLSSEFKLQSCQDLVRQLTGIYNDKGPHKMIVVPRPNLDAKIALTAWRYLDKFNNFDQKRINNFIDGHRDDGPEKTIEQP